MEFSAPAKVILLGEHSVLRGGKALSVPFFKNSLSFQVQEDFFDYEVIGRDQRVYDLIFLGALEKALKKVGKQRQDLGCKIQIISNLPVSRGLGSSAALCTLIAKLFIHKGWLEQKHLYSFSKDIEGLFHGQSSGLDIATVLSKKPLIFHNSSWDTFDITWKPELYLSYSGGSRNTALCVEKVNEIQKTDFKKALSLDEMMNEGTLLAIEALGEGPSSEQSRLEMLSLAINKGCQAFEGWGLIDSSTQEVIENLKKAGALAAKPIGSGLGGYVLSLWASKPSTATLAEIKVL